MQKQELVVSKINPVINVMRLIYLFVEQIVQKMVKLVLLVSVHVLKDKSL